MQNMYLFIITSLVLWTCNGKGNSSPIQYRYSYKQAHRVTELTQSRGNCIVPEKIRSRLGDQLIHFSHAFYLMRQINRLTNHHVRLYYHDFPFAEQLRISQLFLPWTVEQPKRLPENFFIRSWQDARLATARTTVFYIPFFADLEHLWENPYFAQVFPVDWKDTDFINELRHVIKPINPLPLIYPPKNIHSVAIHIRTGGGFDSHFVCVGEPHKFPPLAYYFHQIKTVFALLDNQPLYIFLFTDHPEPQKLKCFFEEQIQNPNITFDCRSANNRHDNNVLEDFFSMQNFDCLIRPGSHFSLMAEKLGNFKIVIYPSLLMNTEKPHESIITYKNKTICSIKTNSAI